MDAKPVPPRDQGMQRQVVGQKTRPTTLDQAWQTGSISQHGQALSSVPSTKGYQDTHTDHSHFLTS